MAEPGIRPMDFYEVSRLRNLCDTYMDPRYYVCGGGMTQFDVDGLSAIRDFATAALNAYNEKEKTNFHLEKIVKLNAIPITCYLTFWARSDEGEGRRLFRAVVNGLRRHNVLLCEIKDDEEITIPTNYDDYDVKPKSEDDHSPHTWVYGIGTQASATYPAAMAPHSRGASSGGLSAAATAELRTTREEVMVVREEARLAMERAERATEQAAAANKECTELRARLGSLEEAVNKLLGGQ